MIYDGLKPGGKAVGWVCGDVPPIREFSRSYISSRIRQNSFVEALSVLSPLAALGRDLANYDQRITIKDDVDLLGIKAGEYTLHEFVTKHFLKAFWATSVSPEMATLYNYDEYSPKYQHRLTDLQWFEICQQVGFQEVSVVKSTASGYTLFLKK
jgi:hypothetical protein